MCGICGQIRLDNGQVQEQLLEAMCKVLHHRGPDDGAVWRKGPAGLGHRRLSIIDLSPDGRQPMCNEDESLWISYNGEVYNFPELRTELIAKGHVFRSKSDTETIIHLYEEEGADCVKRLRGMFAFAIWDMNKGLLTAARDRFGQKPFYWHKSAVAFTFASEIKAIVQDPAVPRAPDRAAIHHYLSLAYVPSPFTAFQGINKLPPGHVLELDATGHVQVHRYWDMDFSHKLAPEKCREQDLLPMLEEQLLDAVRTHMVSDVPLGAFLSGGIDSSAVVAMMARASDRPVRTFSIGFEEESFNELNFARMVSERFGTDHTEFTVRPDMIDVLPRLAWLYGEPYADASALPTYYLAKMTREHVTVTLNGDGGDENFAGYQRYLANRLATSARRAPAALFKSLLRFLDMFGESAQNKNRVVQIKRFCRGVLERPGQGYLLWAGLMGEADKLALYGDAMAHSAAGADSAAMIDDLFARSTGADIVERTMDVDMHSYLPDDLLVKVDVATMAHSLESRPPLLDHVFAEFVAHIPPALKLKGFSSKYILKQLMVPHLPQEILNREKMGFGVPVGLWFRTSLKDYAREILFDAKALERGYFDKAALETYFNGHVQGRFERGQQIWALVMLELWHRLYIDPPHPVHMP
jgi:asparagine synthase (glutamine-hydrolysing)